MRTKGSPEWQEAVRRLAVARVSDGHDVAEVAEFFGVHACSVHRWVEQYRAGGDAALAAVRHPGPPPKLTPRRGCTPRFEQRASHRDKVSVAAAPWLTPCGGLVRLAYRTYPDQFVNNERYAEFLADVLDYPLRRAPAVIVLHDRGNMHRGE